MNTMSNGPLLQFFHYPDGTEFGEKPPEQRPSERSSRAINRRMDRLDGSDGWADVCKTLCGLFADSYKTDKVNAKQ